MFQKNIISITEENVPDVSLDYLKSIVGDIRYVEGFVSKLRSIHIMDEDEFSKGGNILRFSIDSMIIDAMNDNVIDLTKQVVSDFGGAIVTVYLYAVDRDGKFRVNRYGTRLRVLIDPKDMYPENNPRHTHVSSDSPSPSDGSDSDFGIRKKSLPKGKKRKKLNKRKKPEKIEVAKVHLSHALFAHG
ncbi:hypothetical protein RND81_11G137000 [Saponaria officinalis]|uniref:Uncharacterized protein n=1 Tax=Saponaria officinalis TaxID=3572 RepID=A0AAW1HLS7_SAPOF